MSFFIKGEKEILKLVLERWEDQDDFNFYLSILSHQYNFVFRHSTRVACYAVCLARASGCGDRESADIGAAAMLHDIGKINVPIKVLYKQGVYNQYDRAEMERHPIYAQQMLLRSKDLRELTTAVLHHHEHYDGNGYPHKLQKLEIPLPARIIHIAEAFDVMTTIQNYQQLKTREEAIAELERLAGSQFDAALVKAFVELKPACIAERHHAVELCSQDEQLEKPDFGSVVHYMKNIANLGIICLDKNNTVIFCNSYAEKMRQLEDGSLLGKNFLDSYPLHRRAIIGEKLAMLREGEQTEWYRLMGRNGNFIENRYSRVTDDQGRFIGTILVTVDVTEREKVTRSLNMSLERQAALYQAAQIITSSLSLAEVLEGILKIIKKSMVVKHAMIHLVNESDNHIPIVYSSDNYTDCEIECQQDCQWAMRILCNTLKTLTVYGTNDMNRFYIPIIYRKDVLGVLYVERICQGEDSKERLELLETLASQTAIAIRNAKLHEEVAYLAEYDKLTGLMNRHAFDRLFSEYCQTSKVPLKPFTLLMIDINGLKAVNDQYGHVVGDLLIRAAAQVVKKSIRPDDSAFRYGGDEFVILMPGVSLEQANIFIKRIQRNAKWWKPAKTGCRELSLSVSIGAAESREVCVEGLVQEADKRMYENKRNFYKTVRV